MNNWPEELRNYLAYDKLSGQLTWVVSPSNRIVVGAQAGKIWKDGYRRIQFRGKTYSANQVAWWLATGQRSPYLIDHKNLKRDDNRFENLREANRFQNNQNRRGRPNGLPKGVTRQGGKFQAQIRAWGRNHYLGLFSSANEAHNAYCAASIRLHAGFGRDA